MAGLLDIADVTETVFVGSTKIEVSGIGVAGLVGLISRFPELQNLLAGGKVDVGAIIAMGDEILAAIIAAGCGNTNDPRAEAKAARLPIAAQVNLLTAIVRQTMPDGAAPLVQKMTELMSAMNIENVTAPTPTEAPRQASPINSPPELNALLPEDIGVKTYGAIRPDGSLHSWPLAGNA